MKNKHVIRSLGKVIAERDDEVGQLELMLQDLEEQNTELADKLHLAESSDLTHRASVESLQQMLKQSQASEDLAVSKVAEAQVEMDILKKGNKEVHEDNLRYGKEVFKLRSLVWEGQKLDFRPYALSDPVKCETCNRAFMSYMMGSTTWIATTCVNKCDE